MTLEVWSCRTHLAVCPVQTTNLLSPRNLGSRSDNFGEFMEKNDTSTISILTEGKYTTESMVPLCSVAI